MGGNLLVLWTKFFDLHQFALLLVVADGVLSRELLVCLVIVVARMTPNTHLVGVAALLQPCVVEFTAPVKHPLQFFGCLFVRIDAIFVSFHAHLAALLKREKRLLSLFSVYYVFSSL